VGDSPLFLFRDNVIHRLNEDHSLTPYLDQLLAFGKINKDEYQTDARHNQVTSVLMGEDIPKIDVCNDGFQLLDGDILLAASDGLETLPPDAIADMCSNNGNSSIATLLIDAVIDCGARHQDNTTVIAVKV
ncbi:MAG: hypothetical protein ABJH06_16630, partial [Paraglaciecola sp.]|uniref:PP2C family protein-serine/threonine phosphatase n=1 Tax=Paraglaciecola sp. TaxID=1920173 RepID=UPI003296948D